jgi:hypothetical protein
MSKTVNELSGAELRRLADLLEKIEGIQAEIGRLTGGIPSGAPVRHASRNGKGRRTMSAEGRARIAEAQRQRWAKRRGGKPAKEAAGKPKRTMSPEARAKIAAAQKARWAKARAGK